MIRATLQTEAVQEFDRLLAIPQGQLPDWLRTPDLLRVVRILHEQRRASQAATLLAAGAKRRQEDGFTDALRVTAYGFTFEAKNGEVAVTGLVPGSGILSSGLRKGDIFLRIDDVDLTTQVPVKMSETPGGVWRRAPLLSEHAEQLLAEIGIDAQGTQALRERRVVG